MRAARSATGSGRGDAGRDESRPRAVRAWWPSMPSLPSSARQLLGPEEPGVDRDGDKDPGHQDEREGRRGRVVALADEPVLDDVADHLRLGVAEELGVDPVAERGNKRQDRDGEDAG